MVYCLHQEPKLPEYVFLHMFRVIQQAYNYSTLSVSTKEEIDVRFTVPSQYDSQGVKTGDLTFWAVGAN